MHGPPRMNSVQPPPVIEAINVDHRYKGPTGWNHALDQLSLTVPRNELLCVLGPSGCGKSTFLRIVSGLTRPTGGEVLLHGKPITGPGLDRGIVFQEPALFAWLTVVRNVEFGLTMSGWKKSDARERALHVLRTVFRDRRDQSHDIAGVSDQYLDRGTAHRRLCHARY